MSSAGDVTIDGGDKTADCAHLHHGATCCSSRGLRTQIAYCTPHRISGTGDRLGHPRNQFSTTGPGSDYIWSGCRSLKLDVSVLMDYLALSFDEAMCFRGWYGRRNESLGFMVYGRVV